MKNKKLILGLLLAGAMLAPVATTPVMASVQAAVPFAANVAFNGEALDFNSSALIKNDRSYYPFRDICEAMGYQVLYNYSAENGHEIGIQKGEYYNANGVKEYAEKLEFFINPDGTTRIAYLWDQTVSGTPPAGFSVGAEFSREDINLALENGENRLEIVPSEDTLGHGTALAGVAVGNGLADIRGRFAGVAPDAELIVVKVGLANGVVRNIDAMLALKYIVEKAILAQRPVSVLIGFGINEGEHDGTSPLEKFIDDMSIAWRVNVAVGTGNQANKATHGSGIIEQGRTTSIPIFMEAGQQFYQAELWKKFVDVVAVKIRLPNGSSTLEVAYEDGVKSVILGDTIVSVSFAQNSPIARGEQILICLNSFSGDDLVQGVWEIEVRGVEILDGGYDIWANVVGESVFAQPSAEHTLMIPSTSVYATSVSAVDSSGLKIATFSGRGYTKSGDIKPDISAPGVDVTAPVPASDGEFYQLVSGTSVAGAYVAGAYILMLEYGINRVGDNYLFGESLKSYLLRSARRPAGKIYPNSEWGYGELCIRTALQELSKLYEIV